MIEDLFVHPGHRGRGMATTLLHSAVHTLRAQGSDRITIAAGTP